MPAPPPLPMVGTTEANVADVDTSDSDEVIHIDTIPKTPDLPDAAGRPQNSPTPASVNRTPHANLQHTTKLKRISRRDTTPRWIVGGAEGFRC
jgi:hypothetical protein